MLFLNSSHHGSLLKNMIRVGSFLSLDESVTCQGFCFQVFQGFIMSFYQKKKKKVS